MVGGSRGFLWRLRSEPHHPTNRCALVPPSSGRTGSFWFWGWVVGFGFLWELRSSPHHPTDRSAPVPPSSLEEGSFWCTRWVVFSDRLPSPDSRPLKKCSPPFQGGGDRFAVGWFGAVCTSLGDLLHGPSPKSVCGIGASPMTRRRGELRSFGEGSASAGRCGRSVIGRRPDATGEGEKSYELRVKG